MNKCKICKDNYIGYGQDQQTRICEICWHKYKGLPVPIRDYIKDELEIEK